MKKLGVFLVLIFAPLMGHAAPKNILVFVNEGFQAQEYYVPRVAFDKERFTVKVAARYAGVVAPAKKYTEYKPVPVDFTFDQVELSDFDAVVFVGGAGAWEDFFPNPTLHKLLTEALVQRKMTTALICAATGVLATANNLDGKSKPIAEGKHVTGYFQVEGLLRVLGKTNYDPGTKGKPFAVADGNLITARDPESAELFAKMIVDALKNQ